MIPGGMGKAVFTSKIDPTYDDLPEHRYHFPRTYLRQVEQAVGDWIIYYEPPRSSGNQSSTGGRSAYFAVAQLETIVEDPSTPDHYYAFVSNYQDFDQPVPFKAGVRYFESMLEKADGSTNKGAFGRAVRQLPDPEFDLILRAGITGALADFNALAPTSETPLTSGLAEEPAIFERPMIEQLTQKKYRDAAFARHVKTAYENRCAMTGLQIINGGGRPEVQAAHIRPVADNGPDSVRNGLALSGTIHWMFDRGLISVDEDFSILAAKDSIPDTIDRLLVPDRKLILPTIFEQQPHSSFLKYHRENIFKG